MDERVDNTAVRVALWRALHAEIDAPPHVLDDTLGLRLVDPPEGWRDRPDMGARATQHSRASIVGRARFVEDRVAEEAAAGVRQFVILGAGLDTFAERRPDLAATVQVYEVDQPGTQAWKRKRLGEAGIELPAGLRFVPVDFEAGASWWTELASAGFDAAAPAVVASTGVSMYLTRDAIDATLRQVAALAPGSTLIMSYMVPLELVDPQERQGREWAERGAAAAGTPFRSFFSGEAMLEVARAAGFRQVTRVSPGDLAARYFAGRADGLSPSSSEELLVART
jgi:methyltransferase (TIGR00027 family)